LWPVVAALAELADAAPKESTTSARESV